MRCKLKIKPLSVNSANALDKKKFKARVKKKLPKQVTLTKGKLFISYDIYLSNPRSDSNNYVKIMQDAIFEAYNLEDSNIYEQHERKFVCRKGKERIIFTLEPLSTYRLKQAWKQVRVLVLIIFIVSLDIALNILYI